MGQKLRGAYPFLGGAGSHLTQCGLGQGLPPYRVASSSIQLFGHNRHGPKVGGYCAPFWGGGAGSPSNTMSPGLRPTSISSGILIHPAVWPQQPCAKNWGLFPFGGRGAGSPSERMWPGLRPTSVPSFVLIHPFGHNTPTLQTGQTDNDPIT